MDGLTSQTKVADWLIAAPSRSRIFERFGIDYCCGGGKSLHEACTDKGLDIAQVLEELQSAGEPTDNEEAMDWTNRSATELVEHILEVHHVYLRRELPRLEQMSAKVSEIHGQNHPELSEVKILFDSLKAELGSHMLKEERILFPMIRQLEWTSDAGDFHCGSIRNPIQVMELEHEEAGRALARLRELTGDYTPPADACNTYRALLNGLQELEHDLHQHIHEENNLLFPKVVDLESRLR